MDVECPRLVFFASLSAYYDLACAGWAYGGLLFEPYWTWGLADAKHKDIVVL